jgi:hypothetical protein
LVAREPLASEEGISFLRSVLDGHHPRTPYEDTMEIHLSGIEDGRADFVGSPATRYVNSVSPIQGGYQAWKSAPAPAGSGSNQA